MGNEGFWPKGEVLVKDMVRKTIIVILGNILWAGLGLAVFMLFGFLGVTPIGKFAQYCAEQISSGLTPDQITENPQMEILLKGFQFFLGAVVEPIVSFVVAFVCTLIQKNRKLLVTFLAVLPIPAYMNMGYYHTNLKYITVVGAGLDDFVPVFSLLLNILSIYLAFMVVSRIWRGPETDNIAGEVEEASAPSHEG